MKAKTSRNKQKQAQSDGTVSFFHLSIEDFSKLNSSKVPQTTFLTDQKPTAAKAEPENQSPEVLKTEMLQEVPQSVPEASSTAILTPEEKDKASEGARACSLIDLETFQKMRLNNLSNRSAHWDPKVFRKIAQLIDPPKSPTETPPGSSNSSRPNSPDAKNLASKFLTSFCNCRRLKRNLFR